MLQIIELYLKHYALNYKGSFGNKVKFPKPQFGEFQAQNGVIETTPCLGVKIELLKLEFGSPQTL